jgi:hypothetical protein
VSATDVFGISDWSRVRDQLSDPAFWRDVGDDLRGEGLEFWKRHRQTLIEMSREALAEAAVLMKIGRTKEATRLLVDQMNRAEWETWRDSITGRARRLANRRYESRRLAREISKRTAIIIGTAILGVLL